MANLKGFTIYSYSPLDEHDDCGEETSKNDKLHAYGMTFGSCKCIVICNDDCCAPYDVMVYSATDDFNRARLNFNVYRDKRDILSPLTVNEYFLLGRVLKHHGLIFNKKRGTLNPM